LQTYQTFHCRFVVYRFVRTDPEKIAAALELVKAGLSPTVAARQLGLGRSTIYREIGRAVSRGSMLGLIQVGMRR
jgi:DNA invertase Pin-like site-specific DNA recombinase